MTKTDARNIVATMSYDGQNRLITKSYSDGTPAVTYTYDSGCIRTFLCKVAAAGVSTMDYGYNSFGQVTSSTQTTLGTAYPFGYTYDLQGNLKSITYPSGRPSHTR